MPIKLKRVYEPAEKEDGYRILVERLWPRGTSKEKAQVDLWVKDAGASTELRTWFGHDPDRWEEFRKKYFEEIRGRPGVAMILKDKLREHGTITLIYAAHDEQHNNAVALKEYLEKEA